MISLLPYLRRAAVLLAVGWSSCALAAPQAERPAFLPGTCSHPTWPESSLRNGEQGVAVVGVLVAPDGAPARIEVLASSGHPALDEATVAAFRSCRFRPGRVDGQPVEMWHSVTFIWIDPDRPVAGGLLAQERVRVEQKDANAQFKVVMLCAMRMLPALRALENACTPSDQLPLLRRAAEGNHAMAQVQLGMTYELGYGVGRDEQEALRWYEMAAAQGNVLAIERLRLGVLPSMGTSTPF